MSSLIEILGDFVPGVLKRKTNRNNNKQKEIGIHFTTVHLHRKNPEIILQIQTGLPRRSTLPKILKHENNKGK